MPLINTYAGVSREARGLNFVLSFHLHPFFVYVSSGGYGECIFSLTPMMMSLRCSLMPYVQNSRALAHISFKSCFRIKF